MPPSSSPSTSPPEPAAPPPVVWWIIWAAIGFGLVVLFIVLPPLQISVSTDAPMLRYLPLLALAASSVVRWLVLPRLLTASKTRAFSVFIVGLALAEGSGILGLILGDTLRDAYFALALLGVAQFAPFFAAHTKG